MRISVRSYKLTNIDRFPEKKTGYTYLFTVINTVRGQTLSLSYGRCIAEFLDEESLVHLGLLDLSTCVGLRYG
jgi:hypothetical protein